ncbi:MAG: CRISPR-associated helicase Cas3' [Nitrososphaeria archaeon]
MLIQYYNQLLEKNGWVSRKFIEKTISLIEKEWNRKDVFVVEAPTGYGKSSISQTISLYSLNEGFKSIIAYPLRTLLEDQYSKFSKIVSNKEVLGKRYMHNMDSLYLVKPITLTTIDTLSLTLFGIPPEDFEKVARDWSGTSFGSLGHYLFSQVSIILSNIVLDEVHLLSDSTKSLNFLFLLIEYAVENGQKLVLMSATLPAALIEIFENYRLFDGTQLKNRLEIIRFSDKEFCDNEFLDERKNKCYDIILEGVKESEKFDKIIGWIKKGQSEGFSKIIIVFNTVEDAITFYNRLNCEALVDNKILLHSRFNERDRVEKHNKLKILRERDNYIIVSTQTIEAGIDISSNLFITELAPANSLVQRLGRFLRYENENRGQVYIWYELDENGQLKNHKNKYKVYDFDLTTRTLEELKGYGRRESSNNFRCILTSSNMNFHIPEFYQNLLNNVYRNSDFQVNKRSIQEYLKIFLDVESLSRKSFEKYLEVEGSFVRDEMLVPTILKSIIDSLFENKRLAKEDIDFLMENIVTVSVDQLRNLKICTAIKLEKDSESAYEKIECIAISESLTNNPQNLIKFMLKNRIIAISIEGKYNSEFGLILR